jgi:hypothetical protein
MLLIFSVTAAAGLLPAQTKVDLHSQTRSVDFTNAAATKVWKTGVALPGTCNVGEGFFLTGATPGQNLYLCTSSGTWNPAGPAPLPFAGIGTNLQSVGGTFAPNAVPSIDSTNTQVSSGCTAAGGSMTCSAGFSGGSGASRITATEGSVPSAPPADEQTLYIDSSDHNLKSLDSAGTVRQYATLGGAETLGSKTLVNPSLGASALTSTYTNESSTGTALNKLAKLTGNPVTAILASTSDTGGIAGVVVSGGGTSGTSEIAVSGQSSCTFDGATTAGDYVTVSGSIAGDCHDAGNTYPTSGQILGRVLSTNGAGGVYAMNLFGAELQGGAGGGTGGGGSFDPLDETTVWIRDEMLTNTQWSVNASSGAGMIYGDPSYGDPGHPGVFQLYTGAAPNSIAELALSWPNSAQIMHYPYGQVWEMRWVVKLTSLTNGFCEFGFQDYGGHNELKIVFNPALGSDWFGVSRNSDTESTADLGASATTSAWAKIRMRSDMTKVYFSVNGSPEKTVCASGCDIGASVNLGGGSQVYPYALVETPTSTAAAAGIDFFAMQIWGITR